MKIFIPLFLLLITHISIGQFIQQDSTISFTNQHKGNWYQIKPILKEYDNLLYYQEDQFTPIKYTFQQLTNNSILQLNLDTLLGTYHFVKMKLKNIDSTFSSHLPLSVLPNIHTIYIRKDNSYLGYLTELWNTPFLIPPRRIWGLGHQCDLRVGSDCAELAIYGKRRQGFDIRYGGPKGIIKHLDEIKEGELKVGDIIHFGYQVSVFYKDVIPNGKLDPEDLLIHSYIPTPQIIEFQKTPFINYPYKLMRWKF